MTSPHAAFLLSLLAAIASSTAACVGNSCPSVKCTGGQTVRGAKREWARKVNLGSPYLRFFPTQDVLSLCVIMNVARGCSCYLWSRLASSTTTISAPGGGTSAQGNQRGPEVTLPTRRCRVPVSSFSDATC